MRWKKLAWTLALLFTFGLAGLLPAAATDLLHKPVPAGYGQERVINHYVYYPRYKHVYRINGATDPYAYQPEKRGYYPFYNSGYWRPAHEVRGTSSVRSSPCRNTIRPGARPGTTSTRRCRRTAIGISIRSTGELCPPRPAFAMSKSCAAGCDFPVHATFIW